MNIPVRIGYHRKRLRGGTHSNPHLQHAFDKYGLATLTWGVLEFVPVEDLPRREHEWREFLEADFNIAPTSPTGPGGPLPPQTRERMRQAALGNQHAKGFRHSEETKRHLADVCPRAWTPEQREKIRRAKLGCKRSAPVSDRERENRRLAQLGKRHSTETRRKMSERRQELWKRKKGI